MSRKYTFKEIKEYYNEHEKVNGSTSITVQEILNIMEDVMYEENLTEDDRVWEWPDGAKRDKDSYDRAMGVI